MSLERERQAGGLERIGARALRAQRVQQQAERAAPQLRRRVEAVGAFAGRRRCQQEPGGRARLGAEDVGLGCRERGRRHRPRPGRRPGARRRRPGCAGRRRTRPCRRPPERRAAPTCPRRGRPAAARDWSRSWSPARARARRGRPGPDGCCGGCWRGRRSSRPNDIAGPAAARPAVWAVLRSVEGLVQAVTRADRRSAIPSASPHVSIAGSRAWSYRSPMSLGAVTPIFPI